MKTILIILSSAIMLILTSCGGNGSKTIRVSGIEYKTIPGLTASDVHGNFTKIGFILNKNIGVDYSSWTCQLSDDDKEFIVEARGSGPDEIFSVQGTVLNYSNRNINEIGKDFLGYLASLPYKGAQPFEAKSWVIKNLHYGGSTTFGSAKFEIFANGENNRILTITGN